MTDIDTILNSCEDGDENIEFVPQAIEQSKLDRLAKNYNELKGFEVVQNIPYTDPIQIIRRSLLEGQLNAINSSNGGADILKRIADLIRAEPRDSRDKFNISFEKSLGTTANYDKRSNTLMINPKHFIALRGTDSNLHFFNTAPLIHSTSKIEGESVARIEEGLSPDYMVLLHELGHYKDSKNDESFYRLADGMRNNAFDKLQTRLPNIKESIKRADNQFITSINSIPKNSRLRTEASKVKAMYDAKNEYLDALATITKNPQIAPLGRMRNVSGTQTNMDDHLEYKNVFSYYNDGDFSELKFRLDNHEPIRYLYQTKEGILYEPIETIVKKAQYYSDNSNEVRQRLLEHFIKLKSPALELNNINVPYTKLRFADTFKDAFEAYAGRAYNAKDLDNGVIVNDFRYFQKRLGEHHGKRKVITQDMINNEANEILKARLRSKLKSRLQYADIPGDPKTTWLTKFWKS